MTDLANVERASILYRKGRQAIASKDLKAAIVFLQESAKLDPHFKTLELLGECLLDNGCSSEAVTALTQSVERGSKPFRALYLLARAFDSCGSRDRAIESLNRALEMKPDYKAARGLLETLNGASK
jgi:tetratricopeptide (TPR) repeat protein